MLLVLIFVGAAIAFSQTPLRSNGKIAFTSDRDGNREIYVMGSNGNDQVRLTNNSIIDDHPTWSPDGRMIAFLSQNASGAFAIFVMNRDGTGKTEITPITIPAFSNKIMSWSPDGRQLVISHANGLDIVDADGNNRRFLTSGFEPAWSPDGSKILFVNRPLSSAWTLHTIRPDGTEARVLIANLFQAYEIVGYPDWSPDGGRIVFLANDFANQDIFMANSDGTGVHDFAGDCGGLSPQGCSSITSMAWSPDGSKIVYGAIGKIYSIDQNGDGRSVLASIGLNSNPSWQPLARDVSISGRVLTPSGLGLRNAVVTMTDSAGNTRTATSSSFGLYRFDNVPANEIYTLTVRSKRYRFAPRTLTVNENLTEVDLVGLE